MITVFANIQLLPRIATTILTHCYPNWIFDVWYEVDVKLSAFGTKGFGSASIVGFETSPSKLGPTSYTLTPREDVVNFR